MADAAPVVHIGENSPQEVAFKLLDMIAKIERKRLSPIYADTGVNEGETAATRKWVLDTYSECLTATTGGRYVIAAT